MIRFHFVYELSSLDSLENNIVPGRLVSNRNVPNSIGVVISFMDYGQYKGAQVLWTHVLEYSAYENVKCKILATIAVEEGNENA
jgi:hypothetical protein